jgi:hypothetical protein
MRDEGKPFRHFFLFPVLSLTPCRDAFPIIVSAGAGPKPSCYVRGCQVLAIGEESHAERTGRHMDNEAQPSTGPVPNTQVLALA